MNKKQELDKLMILLCERKFPTEKNTHWITLWIDSYYHCTLCGHIFRFEDYINWVLTSDSPDEIVNHACKHLKEYNLLTLL